MKYLHHKLLVALFLPISIYASDVYYCVEEGITGFNPKENLAITKFKEGRFKVMIDFEQNMLQSSDLMFESYIKSTCLAYLDNLNCINDMGRSFIINKETLKFYRGAMYSPGKSNDSVYVSHGYCEKF